MNSQRAPSPVVRPRSSFTLASHPILAAEVLWEPCVYPTTISMSMTTMLIHMSGICRSSLISPYNSVRMRFFTVGAASGPGLSQPTERGSEKKTGATGSGGEISQTIT